MFADEVTLERVREIIAEVTGNEIDDVLPESHLEDDLGVLPMDFKRLISRLDTEFGIHLESNEIIEEIETVHQLTLVVAEEKELG